MEKDNSSNLEVVEQVSSDLRHGQCLDLARGDFMSLSTLKPEDMDLEVCLAAYQSEREYSSLQGGDESELEKAERR